MRLLFLTEERISFDEPLVRGGAIHVRNVVRGLRARGHEVFLLDWGARSERPYQYSLSPWFRFAVDPVRTVRRATTVGRRHDIDAIVSKTRKIYLPGLVAARRLSVPHVVHVGSSLERTSTGFLDWLDSTSFAARLQAPHDAYFVVCEHIADQLVARDISLGQVYNVRNAVDTDRFHPSKVPTPLEERFQRPLSKLPDGLDDGGDRLRLGYVGGLQPLKGLADLADAVERASVDPTLVVAGDGPERDRLESRFGEQACFLGSVPYDQVPAVYHEMDAFVLPSHTEGLPRVVLEAQATATPVVATRVGGVPEVVTDGETGLLCPPRSPVALADTIDNLAADRREWLGSNGRDAITSSFSWANLYDRYERFFIALAQ